MARPATWEDSEAFEKAVDEYFNNTEINHTWTGLAIHLGFESRQSLEDYKSKDGFSYPIKKALLRIERKYEEAMMKQPAGAIFALKNFGWKDKQEVDSRTVIEDERTDLTKLTDDELRTLVTLQSKGRVSKA